MSHALTPCPRNRGKASCWNLCRQVMAGLILAAAGLPLATQAGGGFFPKGTNVTSLIVIADGNLANSAQKVMIATLQGIVARQSAQQIYIDGGGGYSKWYPQLTTAYGIPYAITSSPWTILNQFKGLVGGYIRFDLAANSNSLNAASSLCGPFNAIAVDASIESTVRSYGITNLIVDVSQHNDEWVWTNYNALLSRNVVIEQQGYFYDQLRDYASMAGAFTFFEGNTPFRSSIMGQMNPDSACLGWGDGSQGENTFVGNSSSNGVFVVPSDYALNLSTLSSIQDSSLSQRTYANPVSETNVLYVAFVVTDGDNVQWDLGGEPDYFNNPARGKFNMGWALSPSLADLAPSVLRWHYDSASNGSNNSDFFVAGPSGVGYMYPSMYPAAELDLHVQKLDDFMNRADLNIAQVIDFNSYSRMDLWNKYLTQPNINGLFYLEYSRYNGANGALSFSTNGQPIMAARDLLWAGLEEETNLLANLNSYPRDPSSPAGYCLVAVHVWDKSQTNVLQVVTNLPPDVRVVTPDVFVKLIRNNVGRKLSYDFASGLQGWSGSINGKAFDKAQWTGSAGNPPGALLLDGSDLGKPDSTPNSWFTRQIILPPNATTLSFDTLANNDGLLRVRLQLGNGTFVTLLDWAGLTNHNSWVTSTADLSSYAGQTVTLYFEQNDGGQGSGEYRYVDNVAVLTAGPALYAPAAPKLLAAIATNSVGLRWRDNDNNEAGFAIERSSGTNGIWDQIVNVASNVTAYVDGSVTQGVSYSYRLRSWNASGYSAYSNVRIAGSAPNRMPISPIDPSVFAYSSQLSTFSRQAIHTVDGSGLTAGSSGVLGAADSTVDNNAGNMWTSDGTYSPNDFNPSITYDLGGVYNLQTTRIWNYNEGGFSRVGPADILLSTSVDGTTFTQFGHIHPAQTAGNNGQPGEDFAMSIANVRYVKLQILTNWDGAIFWSSITGGSSNGVDGRALTGLSEVRFEGTRVIVQPVISGGASLGGGQFKLTFSGLSGQRYSVLSSTNVALPLSNWTVLTSGTFGGSPINYTNTTATNTSQFYIISSP